MYFQLFKNSRDETVNSVHGLSEQLESGNMTLTLIFHFDTESPPWFLFLFEGPWVLAPSPLFAHALVVIWLVSLWI